MNVTVTDTASHLASVRCTPPVPFTIVPPGQPTVTLTLTPNGNQTINNVSGSGSLASSLVTVSITDGNGAAISGSYDFSYDLNTPNTSIGQAASQTITGRRNISCAGEVLPFFANSTDTSKSITKLSNGDKIRIKFPTLCYKPDGVSAYNLTGTYTVPIAIKNSDGTVAASSQINVSVNVPKINP
jgi:hypothetical protein